MIPWRCENLTYAHRVKSVDLQLEAGRVCALVGPSGSGKSTLLSLWAGLLPPFAGRVEPCPGRLGMVFQEPSLWDHLKVQQHLSLLTQDRALVDDLLGRMRLGEFKKRRPPQLSGGEKQRLAFARALAVRPDWLLLDEPTAHLDGASRDEMLALLRETLADTERGVLLATHEADVALQCADDVAVLIGGRLVQIGPTSEVYNAPVSLEAARLLGPAFALTGQRAGTDFFHERILLIKEVHRPEPGDPTLIVRPDWIRLDPSAEGSAEVLGSVYQGSHFLIELRVGPHTLQVRHPGPVPAGSRGTLTWLGSIGVRIKP